MLVLESEEGEATVANADQTTKHSSCDLIVGGNQQSGSHQSPIYKGGILLRAAKASERTTDPVMDYDPPLKETTSVLRAATRPGVTFFLTIEEISQLTISQWKVLGLFSAGKTPKEVSEELWIGESTISTHRRAILKAFRASSYRQAVSVARRMGLIV